MIHDTLRDIAGTREIIAEEQVLAEKLQAEIDGSALGIRLLTQNGRLDALREELSRLEAQARAEALELYAQTGNKKPADGVGIRVYTRLRYEASEALAWCREHAPAFIAETLDKKGFEKVAADLGAPVETEEYPQATLAKNLSVYLGGEACTKG